MLDRLEHELTSIDSLDDESLLRVDEGVNAVFRIGSETSRSNVTESTSNHVQNVFVEQSHDVLDDRECDEQQRWNAI